MSKTEDIPEIEEKTQEELAEIIQVIQESTLPGSIKDFIIKCINLALWFPAVLEKKTLSLNRLRKMLFGKGYKANQKARSLTALRHTSNKTPAAHSDTEVQASVATSIEQTVNPSPAEDAATPQAKMPGHGRIPHSAYVAAHTITLNVTGLSVGSACPEVCGGKLYTYNPTKPRILIRIKGQNFADVYKYTVEQLRCNLCGFLVQADIPKEVGKDKYDASFKAWLVLQKYFMAVPFYRQEAFQRLLNFPLPDSTQWALVESVGGCCYRLFDTLQACAANGRVIHNDDTALRIQEVIQACKYNPEAKRRGMFTSGFMAEYEGHRIALFLNGQKHAGENLTDILQKRAADKPPIIQMCDALSCNIPQGVETILAYCMSHGFRKFQDCVEYFPVPCMTIMRLLSQVYEQDEKTRALSDTERLAHHQTHSQPVIDTLQVYLQALFDEKQVEPNSECGKAVKYLQKHWAKLTRFLTVAGAPLCNNVLERALKIVIRNRKAAFFYRTAYSAHLGGMLTSLIYTCHLAQENPQHYLTALQIHQEAVHQNPQAWLPWAYQATLNQVQAKDTHEAAYGPALADLAVGL